MSENKAEEEITFLVTNNPLERSSANKRRVRSVAALKSWPSRRQKSTEKKKQSNKYPNQGGFILDLPGPPSPSEKSVPPRKKRAQNPVAASSSSSSTLAPSHPFISIQHPSKAIVEAEQEPLFEICTRATNGSCRCTHCEADRMAYGNTRPFQFIVEHSRKRSADGQIKVTEHLQPRARSAPILSLPKSSSTSTPSPSTVLSRVTRAEPFGQYPVPYEPWYDRILHHMMNVFAPRGWPALKITNEEGLRWEWFMTQHALSEPALFYVRLLFASGDLIRLQSFDPKASLWLQDQAVAAINEALSDPKRATSDALILAVGRIALHESLYGDRTAATKIHRPAQKRMISLRGGMKQLSFPELVKRLMRWADTVMAKQSGTRRLLEDDEESENFSMKQHVEVLDLWMPSEGQDLRRKITISDLLSPDPSNAP